MSQQKLTIFPVTLHRTGFLSQPTRNMFIQVEGEQWG